jgi:ascorbate-specific PTS system EIIC-type component UlaA
MKKSVGILLMVAGAAVIVVGLYVALSAFAGMYASNLSDPLNQPEGAEANVKGEMMRGVIIGAAGAPVFIAGRVLMLVARRRAARR